MQEKVEYFSNHDLAVKFPFTLYHSPIERTIEQEVSALSGIPKVLNLGCGLFGSYPMLKMIARWSACDTDQHAVAEVQRRYPDLEAFVCEEIPKLPGDTYDGIVSKEVIEHSLKPNEWVKALYESLRPGGVLLLSTPNYGISILPILEYTILEILARLKGFSRFHIHPTKFTRRRLQNLLRGACPGAEVSVKKISFGMVLFAKVRKPAAQDILKRSLS